MKLWPTYLVDGLDATSSSDGSVLLADGLRLGTGLHIAALAAHGRVGGAQECPVATGKGTVTFFSQHV